MQVHKNQVNLVFADKPTIDAIVKENTELHRRCEKYRNAYMHAIRTYSEWVNTNIGPHEIIPPHPGSNIFAIRYAEGELRIPGWYAPSKKYNNVYPARKLEKELKAIMPVMPSVYDIYEGIIPTQLIYASVGDDAENSCGGSSSIIGRYVEPRFSFFQSNEDAQKFWYFLEVPNVDYHKQNIIKLNKEFGDNNVEITGPVEALNWEWPDDLSAITENEYKYIWAEYKKDKEDEEIYKMLMASPMEELNNG